jgi:hypothetical protein
MSSLQILTLHDSGNIAVALRQIEAGTALASIGRSAADKIPLGYKMAMEPIAAGARITKYGQIIGIAHAGHSRRLARACAQRRDGQLRAQRDIRLRSP